MSKARSTLLAAVLLLVLPVATYVALYLLPLVSIGGLALDNGALSQRFPSLSARFSESADVDDTAAAALLADLQGMAKKDRAEVGRMFNQ